MRFPSFSDAGIKVAPLGLSKPMNVEDLKLPATDDYPLAATFSGGNEEMEMKL